MSLNSSVPSPGNLCLIHQFCDFLGVRSDRDIFGKLSRHVAARREMAFLQTRLALCSPRFQIPISKEPSRPQKGAATPPPPVDLTSLLKTPLPSFFSCPIVTRRGVI